MSTLGERIRQLRGTSSQQDFADKLSITRQYVALLESDKREPSPLLVDSLCQKFNVRREWLELGLDPMREEQLADDPAMLVPDLMETLSAYPAVLDLFRRVVNHMTPADWGRLNQLIDDVQNKNPQA